MGNYLATVQKISIGDSRDAIEKIFGRPDEIEATENGGYSLTYTIPSHEIQIPKVILFLGADGKVRSKFINLFKETKDDMKMIEAEKYLGKLKLDKVPPTYKGHFISSEVVFVDRERGVFLVVDSSRSNNVQSITWTSPSNTLRKLSGD